MKKFALTQNSIFIKRLFFIVCLILFIFTAGCRGNTKHNSQDPYETFNRASFALNKKLDKGILKPVAKAYNYVLPSQVTTGITNMYKNIDEPTIIVDDLLQGDLLHAMSDSWRFFINSTFGILGFFDVATKMKYPIPYHYNDFGLTLAKWGDKDSAYFVLPLFGPRTIRDAIGLTVDYYGFSVYPWIKPLSAELSVLGVDYLGKRANYLSYQNILQQAVIDPYTFERDAYLQYRENLVEKLNKDQHSIPEEIDSKGKPQKHHYFLTPS